MTTDKFLKVIDHPELVKDTQSKAVLVQDQKAIMEHRQKLHVFKNLMNQEQEITNLKNDISEIKSLLHKLVQDK